MTRKNSTSVRASDDGADVSSSAAGAEQPSTAPSDARTTSSIADQLFRPLCEQPTTADAIAQLGALELLFEPAHAVEQAARWHREALANNPSLSALIRTREFADKVVSLVGNTAQIAHFTQTYAEARAIAEAAARRRWWVAIAEQLDGDLPKALLAAVAAEARAAAEQVELEAKAAAEAARAAAEREAAERAAMDALVERARQKASAAAEGRAALDVLERDHRAAKADLLVARIRASKIDLLRAGHECFDAATIIGQAPNLGDFDLDRFSAAIDRYEATAS